MDFVRLGARYTSTYIPDMLIEGYNSLIWTERFQAPGEFEIKSFDVDGLRALLPEDTLVSHLETREVMQVETHSVEMVGEGADARPEVTITGHSATSILSHRWVKGPYQKQRIMKFAASATSTLGLLLVNAIDNATGYDLTRAEGNFGWTTLDVIPNIAITESVSAEGATRNWWLEMGILWPRFEQIMIEGDLGLRTIRPVSALTPATVITAYSDLARRGQVVRTFNPDVRELQFNVYSGTDRSETVAISQLQGHLDKPMVLTSNVEYQSGIAVASDIVDISDLYRSPADAALSGWRRRMTSYDAGSPDLEEAPEKPKELKKNATKAQKEARADAMDQWIDDYDAWKAKRTATLNSFRTSQTSAALAELKKANRLNMFSGEMSASAPYKYKTHYDLGDVVSLVGVNRETAKMRVAEYVRTEDANGDRGIPGLVEP